MLKKIFSSILALSILLFSSVAMAYNYQPSVPKYLNGDKNYIYCGAYRTWVGYAVRNSLNVERYNPPDYVISIDIVNLENRGKMEIKGRDTARFAYDWESKQAYKIEKDGNWTLLDPISHTEGIGYGGSRLVEAQEAEIFFYLAYKKKFYGIYPDDFYEYYD